MTNLTIGRRAPYSPMFAYRRTVEQLKRRPVLEGHGIHIPGIQDIQHSLPHHNILSTRDLEGDLRLFHYLADPIIAFNGSTSLKRMKWELQKASRAELDWAVDAALRMVSPTGGMHAQAHTQPPVLLVYGDDKFNTRKSLATKPRRRLRRRDPCYSHRCRHKFRCAGNLSLLFRSLLFKGREA